MIDSGDDELEQKLASLARRTDALRARPGFDARVMRAVGSADFRRGLLGAGRRLLPAAALAAVVSLVWAVLSENSTNATLAVADNPVELAW